MENTHWHYLHKQTNGKNKKNRSEFGVQERNLILQNKDAIELYFKKFGLEIYRVEISYYGSVYLKMWKGDFLYVARISNHIAPGGRDCILNICDFNGYFCPNKLDDKTVIEGMQIVECRQLDEKMRRQEFEQNMAKRKESRTLIQQNVSSNETTRSVSENMLYLESMLNG